MDRTVDISSIWMVDWNVLSILAKSDFEFNEQMEAGEKKMWKGKKGGNRRNQKIINVDNAKIQKNPSVNPWISAVFWNKRKKFLFSHPYQDILEQAPEILVKFSC